MTGHLDLQQRYKTMTTDELVRLAVDREKLTTDAAETLAHELKERNLDSPDAIREYDRERDRQIEQAKKAAAGRWSTMLGINKVTEPLKRRPLLASLVSICCTVVSFETFALLHINSHLLLFLLFIIAAFATKCGLMAMRSSSPFPIRALGLLAAVVGVIFSFMFLLFAILGVG